MSVAICFFDKEKIFMDCQNRKYLYVVEGNTDEDKLKKIGAEFVVKTGGKFIRKDILQFLKEIHKTREIVLVTDPDGPGRLINDLVEKEIGLCIKIKADKKKAIKHDKVGIAEMKIEDIKLLLATYLKHDQEIVEKDYFSKDDFIDCQLFGPNGKKRRIALIEKYHMPFSSAKNVLDAIRMLGLTKKEVEEVIS